MILANQMMHDLFVITFICIIVACHGQDRVLRGRTNTLDNTLDGHNKTDTSQERQRVVFIAGPHKTGSSSIQNNIYRWTSRGRKNNFLPNWSWPVPREIGRNFFPANKEHWHGKEFYPFAEAIRGCKFGPRTLPSDFSCQQLIKLYRNEFKKSWNAGSNLLIGTEAFDYVSSKEDPIELDTLLNLMPWNLGNDNIKGSNDDITVILKYRSPRSSHLISWWHQCCMKDMSFHQYLSKKMKIDHGAGRVIDSLHLVEHFLEKGLKVVLIDLSGVLRRNYDVSNIIVCDVLNVPCSQDKVPEGENKAPMVANSKRGGDMGGVTQEQIDKIEKIIRRRDCSFQSLLTHENLTLLYAEDLLEIMKSCGSDEGISREEMTNEIIQIAAN
mmetsp:Transcript_436/g.607  ORF Transcript_436/g.607 Transcript_436/m.607 type:complete len:383 (-) Transcript_436:42-1190(-)